VITVSIANQQSHLPVDTRRVKAAVCAALRAEGVEQAAVSVAVVDDAAIAELHGRYLGEPEPTDVLSFFLECENGHLEGEVVVSAQTAAIEAARFGWSPADELLLYVVHGTLHLAGHEDATREGRNAMRRRERVCLKRFGLAVRYGAGGAEHRTARSRRSRTRETGGSGPR